MARPQGGHVQFYTLTAARLPKVETNAGSRMLVITGDLLVVDEFVRGWFEFYQIQDKVVAVHKRNIMGLHKLGPSDNGDRYYQLGTTSDTHFVCHSKVDEMHYMVKRSYESLPIEVILRMAQFATSWTPPANQAMVPFAVTVTGRRKRPEVPIGDRQPRS